MAWRQRHLVDLGRVPCIYDQAPALRVAFYFGDDLLDLVDAYSVFAAPIAPLRAIDAAEVAVAVGPFVPNRYAVFVEIFDVSIAAQKPEQLVDDGLEVKFFGGE